MKEKYDAKGFMYFRATKEGYEILTEEKETVLKPYDGEDFMNTFTKNIYYIMDGVEFLKAVDSGCFIDYDGSIANVFVDGYISNLGLAHKGICQGKFLVNKEIWMDICEDFKVEVNWANK